ncbi:hypothetical protein Tco_0145754 [Tanacetum coccineum]
MANLKFADTHNMVAFLSKPTESEGFEQIVDFLNAHPIKYALTINPTIYIYCIEQFWSTGLVKTINGEQQLHSLVNGKNVIITESTVRRDIQLEDEEGDKEVQLENDLVLVAFCSETCVLSWKLECVLPTTSKLVFCQVIKDP